MEPDSNVFLCPVCGHHNVHLGPVTIQQGPDYMVVGDKNEVVDQYAIPATDNLGFPETFPRGSSVTMDMWCEHGHRWQYSIGFHKGSVYTFMMRQADWVAEGDPEELWRD